MRLEELVNGAEEALRLAHKDSEGKKKRFDGIAFLDLWNDVAKKAALSKSVKDDAITDFYSELLQDPRFVNVGSNKWRLREFVPFDDYKRIKGAMYGIENLERVEEEQRTKEIPSDGKVESVIETEDNPEEEEESETAPVESTDDAE